MFEFVQPFDNAFLHAVQNLFPAGLNGFFEVVTLLGNPILWLLVAILLYWNNREKKAFFLVNLILFSSAVAGTLKAAIARPRPSPSEFRVSPESAWMRKLEQGFDFSFPSGHATTITAMVAYYLNQYKKKIYWILGILAILLVGLSRLVLGLHFLSDVIAGIVIGLIVGAVAWKAQQSLENHHFQLTKMRAEAGFVLVILLALVLAFWLDKPALVAVLLGFYGGFFLGKEIGFRQSNMNFSRRLAKTIIGLAVLGIILVPAIFWVDGISQFVLLLLSGFWVSFLYPWLFEKSLGKSGAKP